MNKKIVVLRRFDRYVPGDVLALPAHKANDLLKRGYAREAEDKDLAPTPRRDRAIPAKNRIVVKLLKRAFTYTKGDVVAFEAARARAMIEDGVAELHEPKAEASAEAAEPKRSGRNRRTASK